ncbi:MucR family transcriptional regulator [Brucella anthropi]|uniref:MucR family transcriptional regulator n=1 Tax=Brucella anthropi TaxID=529 RepID=UPI000E0EDD1D
MLETMPCQASELANMIRTTKAAPSEDAKPEAPPEPEYVPTVSVKTSLESRDHIGLLQGRPCKSLKRHLAIRAYIRGVPLPVQAAGRLSDGSPGYSEQRRQAAKRLGLGRKNADGRCVAECG